MTANDPRRGRPYRRAVALMWAHWREAGHGTMCHLCGHQGATEADHLETIAANPHQVPHWTRMKPAHGVNPKAGRDGRCTHPDCVAIAGGPRVCNQNRGAKTIEQVAQPMPIKTSKRW